MPRDAPVLLYGVTAGLIVCAAALAVAAAAGLFWRQRNGTFRATAGKRGAGRGAAAAGPGITGPCITGPGTTGPEISGAELGGPLGSRATLLQFSSAFCAPCRATRRVLAEVAGMTDGVAHLEIDAESHLGLVRRLDVRRTPTVFVLGPDGRIAHRASGQPRKADVIAALGEVT
jgi:thiol-disulfide isomerase/thioredoxin